jgi:excisionase family DNA binding protein
MTITTDNSARKHPVAPLAYGIDDFCTAIGIGRSTVYALIRKGELASVKRGKRRLITAEEALRWLSAKTGT